MQEVSIAQVLSGLSMPGSKSPWVSIKPIEKIPMELIDAFVIETAAAGYESWVNSKDSLKIGAFYNGKCIGFAAGFAKNVLYFSRLQKGKKRKIYSTPALPETGKKDQISPLVALYVKPEFRGRGIAKRMLYYFASEAKSRGLHGVGLYRMVHRMQEIFKKEQARFEQKGEQSPLIFKFIKGAEGSQDRYSHGLITFKRPRQLKVQKMRKPKLK